MVATSPSVARQPVRSALLADTSVKKFLRQGGHRAQYSTIARTIDGLVLTNPHAFIRLSVVGDEVRTRTWAVELEGATQLRQKGIDGTTFAIGDTVTVCANPGRDVNQYRLLMLELRRLSDGFPSGRRIRRGVSSVAAPRHRLYSRDNRRFPTVMGSGCDAHTVPPL